MNMTRRELGASFGALAASAALGRLEAVASGTSAADEIPSAVAPRFPRKADFTIVDGYSYLNGAFSHPMPRAAAEACHQAVERRATLAPPGVPFVYLNPPPDTTPMPVDPGTPLRTHQREAGGSVTSPIPAPGRTWWSRHSASRASREMW